jgi:hypothetical protein
MKLNLNSLLKDKNVLYVVLFIAITNIFGYLMLRNFDAIVFFFVVGFLSTYFSKNMILVMIIAMISTNLLVGIKLLGSYKEGMATSNSAGSSSADSKPASKPDSKAGAPSSALKLPNTNKKKSKMIDNMTTLSPASLDGSDDDTTDVIQGAKPKINYASTLESAYDNLDKLLSSDSINKMTEDTQRLAQKQQVLMGNIEKLVPFIGKAENLLKGMNSDKMGGMLEKMQEQMANLTRSAK